MDNGQLRPESLVITAGRPAHAGAAPLNAPIVLAAPFHHDPVADDNHYARQHSTDTVRALEEAIGSLEGGIAIAFGSGMAAVAALAEGQPAGAVAVVPTAAYSGTVILFDEQHRLGRMSLRPVASDDTEAVLAALPGADLMWIETATNPLLAIPDLPVLIAAAHDAGALACVDSTFSTPMVVRPLDFGADIVMHSVTKFLGGHSDLILGVLVTRSAELAEALRRRRTMTGALPGALEAYLAVRGIRTLAVRMQRAQDNAMQLAGRLAQHPAVSRVRFPGLPGDSGHERASRLHDGYGAVISFEVAGSVEDADRVCRSVRLISHATSLGGVESLIERRARYELDAAHGTPPTLLRLSVGIEHVEDIWADLNQALTG
jgi:cystathionine gamma-synthase